MIDRERFFYRGTTLGWRGNPVLQELCKTPASTDPLVATLFAIEASRHGSGVVYVARIADAAAHWTSPNVLAELEREIVVGLSPIEFVEKLASHQLTAEKCRQVLSEMGIDAPIAIASRWMLDRLLESTPRLTRAQIDEFDARSQA